MAGRPDPRPTRLLAAMAGLAAATAIAAGLIQPTPPPADDGLGPAGAAPEPTASSAPVAAIRVRRETRYVQLQPGETAPPGATVVRRPDPSPRVVVVTLPAPARKARTRQSGG